MGLITSTAHSLVDLSSTFAPLSYLDLKPSSLVAEESGVFQSVDHDTPSLGPIVRPAASTVRIN